MTTVVGGKTRGELAGADGARIAGRELDATGTCEDLASAVAVVIATWEAALDPLTCPKGRA